MPEEYKEQLSLTARLLCFDVGQFQSRYQRRDSIYYYFKTILTIVNQKSVLVLEPFLVEKIYQISLHFAFCYPKDQEIQALRKILFHKLKESEKSLSANREELEKIIYEERQIRSIPSNIPIEGMHILEMYKLDFQNYVNIYYQPLADEKIDLFYYLSSVNKFCHDCPESILEVQTVIEFMITRLIRENWFSDEILAYAENTVQRFYLSKKKDKVKVIDFLKKD